MSQRERRARCPCQAALGVRASTLSRALVTPLRPAKKVSLNTPVGIMIVIAQPDRVFFRVSPPILGGVESRIRRAGVRTRRTLRLQADLVQQTGDVALQIGIHVYDGGRRSRRLGVLGTAGRRPRMGRSLSFV